MISDKILSLSVATLLLTCMSAGSQEQDRFDVLDRTNDDPLRLKTDEALTPLPINAQGVDVLPEVVFRPGTALMWSRVI